MLLRTAAAFSAYVLLVRIRSNKVDTNLKNRR